MDNVLSSQVKGRNKPRKKDSGARQKNANFSGRRSASRLGREKHSRYRKNVDIRIVTAKNNALFQPDVTILSNHGREELIISICVR